MEPTLKCEKVGGIMIPRPADYWEVKKKNDELIATPEGLNNVVGMYVEKNGSLINPDKARHAFSDYKKYDATGYTDAFPGGAVARAAYDRFIDDPVFDKVFHPFAGPCSGKGTILQLPMVKSRITPTTITVDDPMCDNPEDEFAKIEKEIEKGKSRENVYVYRPIESATKGLLVRAIDAPSEDKGRCMTLPIFAIAHYSAQRNARLSKKRFEGNTNVSLACIDNSEDSPERAEFIEEDKIDDFLESKRFKSAEAVLRKCAEVFDRDCADRADRGVPVDKKYREAIIGIGTKSATELVENHLEEDFNNIKETAANRTSKKYIPFNDGMLKQEAKVLARSFLYVAFETSDCYSMTSRSSVKNSDELAFGENIKFVDADRNTMEIQSSNPLASPTWNMQKSPISANNLGTGSGASGMHHFNEFHETDEVYDVPENVTRSQANLAPVVSPASASKWDFCGCLGMRKTAQSSSR